MNLRDTAERVGVLNVLLRTVYQFAAAEKAHESLCGIELAFMGAEPVSKRQEGLDAAVEGIQRQGADEVGPFAEAVALDKAPDRVGAHELRSVQKGQTLLALEGDRLPAFLLPYL